MRTGKMLLYVPLLMMTGSLMAGCATQTATTKPAEKPAMTAMAAEKPAENVTVVKGKILGVSQKAKTIAMEAGGTNLIIKFTDETKGVEHAAKDEAAIITYRTAGKDKIATVIKPKLAELPPGVIEILPEELATLVAMGPEIGNYLLIDARPGARYAEGHIPTSISIPVKAMEEKGAELLPKEKDKLLIFYCGGPT